MVIQVLNSKLGITSFEFQTRNYKFWISLESAIPSLESVIPSLEFKTCMTIKS